MKTQLSLVNLLKTTDEDIFIFDRNNKGEFDQTQAPLKWTSYRSHTFCSELVDKVEDTANTLICKVHDVLTQVDLQQIAKIYSDELSIKVWYYHHNWDEYYMTELNFNNDCSFDFLSSHYFFILKSEYDNHFKHWSKE